MFLFGLLLAVTAENDNFSSVISQMEALSLKESAVAVTYKIGADCEIDLQNFESSSSELALSHDYLQAQLRGFSESIRSTHIDGHLNVTPTTTVSFALLSLECKIMKDGSIVDLKKGLSSAELIDGSVVDNTTYSETFTFSIENKI